MLLLQSSRGEVNIAVQIHRKGKGRIRVTYVAAKLIAEVRAVVRPVTLEGASNTGAIETLELILSTSGTSCSGNRSRSKLGHLREGSTEIGEKTEYRCRND